MEQRWSFPDAGKLYSRKLVVERCLLALVRHEASQNLEKADIEALETLQKMLAAACEVDYKNNITSLSADTSTNVNLVVNLLLATKLVTTLPDVKDYLQQLMDTIAVVKENEVVGRKQREKVVKFAQVFSTNLGSEITAKSRGPGTLVRVL